MKRNLLTLSAVCLLLIVSCKKKSAKEDERKLPCQMTSVTGKSSNNGEPTSSTDTYSYDDKGRIIKIKDNSGYEINYSFSSSQIIEESPLYGTSSYKKNYQLDASGKIVSANMKYSLDGSDAYYSIKYLYNSEGYLSEMHQTDKGTTGTYEGTTDLDKYNYTNGNLTSILRIYAGQLGNTRTIAISYTNELAPSNFVTAYDREILNIEILKAYFGKTSKNLISKIDDDRKSAVSLYTYQKNSEGNVNQMTKTVRSNVITNEFTYNCR